MKTKTKNTDTEIDDEELRIQGITDGPRSIDGREMRPVTALTISWMQRNKFFDPDRDLIWKSAAFHLLHSEPIPKLRAVVNDRAAFTDFVDAWVEKTNPDKKTLTTLNDQMESAFNLYMSATTESGADSGN